MERYRGDTSPFGEPRGKPAFLRAEERGRAPQRSLDRDVEEWHQQMLDAGLVRPKSNLMTRRKFLIGSATVGAAALDWTTRSSPLAKFLDDKMYGQYDYDATVTEAKRIFKDRYGINLFVGLDPSSGSKDIKANPTTLDRYLNSLRFLSEELSKYPPDMVRAVGEARGFEIRIVGSLLIEIEGKTPTQRGFVRAGGAAPWLRSGKPAQLIIDANNTEFSQRSMAHHELNHRFANKWENLKERDAKWIAFHSSISSSPYRPEPQNILNYEKPPERYFLNYHARAAPIEDEAVCAEWMMTPDLIVEFVQRWTNEKDPKIKNILAAKYIETKNNYAKWSEGRIGDEFWIDMINEGRRRKGWPPLKRE